MERRDGASNVERGGRSGGESGESRLLGVIRLAEEVGGAETRSQYDASVTVSEKEAHHKEDAGQHPER